LVAYSTKDSDIVLFQIDDFFSVKTFLGEYRCINLSDYNHLALVERTPDKYYTMQAEKIKCSDAVLHHLLERRAGLIELESPIIDSEDSY